MKLLFLSFAFGLGCFGADVALTFGLRDNFKSKIQSGGQTVEASSSNSVLLTPSINFVNIGVAAIGWETPIAFGGPGRALISDGRIATEKLDFMIVPGVRAKILPMGRFSPWASVGIGAGRFSRATVSNASSLLRAATNTSFTVAVGVGLDVKIAGPLFLRAEGRNFNYKGVEDLRRNSFQFFAGAGLRF
jgi:opacity protein-like surface antigen